MVLMLGLTAPLPIYAQDAPADNPAETTDPQPAAAPPAVRTLIVAPAAPALSRQFYGRVRARETVDLSFEVAGTLAELIPEEGARVAAGTAIAALDRSDFERAVSRAELQRDMAARDAERAQLLADRAVGAASQAEDTGTALGLAEIALRDARAALDDATLRAPFDALVAARLTPAQSSVTPGQPILRLHDMSQVRVEIDLPERVFVAAGGLKAMTFSAAMPLGDTLPLSLVAFRPDTEAVGQTYLVTLAFAGDPGAALLPGAAVTVTAQVPTTDAGVTVPASAVIAGNDRSASVLVLDGAGDTATVRRVPVDLGTRTGTTFDALGLAPGTEIVAIGAHRLRDGQTVRRFVPLTGGDD